MSRFTSPDTLTSLFGTGESQSVFRYGTLTAWDAVTKENTVSVNSTTFDDLPVFEPAVATLGTGGLVLLYPMGSKYLIMGRIVSA